MLFLNEYRGYIQDTLSDNFILKCLQINCIIAVLFYAAMHFFNLHLLLIDDPYFINNELRYTNLASYIIPFLFLYKITSANKIKLKEGLYMLIPMLLTGNRTIILVTVFVALFYYFIKWDIKTKLRALVISPIVAVLIFFSISSLSENSSLSRFTKLVNIEYLNRAVSTRLKPILVSFEDYEPYQYITGNGFGHSYYIPWFEYREGIKNYNIYLDNLYATLYGKFGILFFIPILFFVSILRKYSSKEVFIYLLVYFLLLGLTNSFLYQPYLPWFIFIMAITIKNATDKS